MMPYGSTKYGAKKMVIEGTTFASQKEGRRFLELQLMEKAGVILDLQLQPVFMLQEKFEYFGEKIREIKYIADFQYFDKELGYVVVEDVKGMILPEFKLKAKLFKFRYPHLHLRIT